MNFNFLLVQPIGNICKSASFVPRSLLVLVLLTGLGSLTKVEADGMFVAPKFVWDKHKDINEPTQKAIIVYDAGREDLILQVKYEGPVSEFGWLVPVPNLPTVQKGSMKCFYELSQYTQRHFETAWQHNQTKSMSLGVAGIDSEGKSEPPVKVIEIKTVGAYEIAVLATKDTGALEKWLEANHFSFPTNATAVIDSYVQRQWYFVAAKVNLEQGALGLVSSALKLPAGELNPLQISFASEHCVYPLKISSANGTPSEIQVYVLSPEPLLEKAMLEKKLPTIYSNDIVRAKTSAQRFEKFRRMERDQNERFMGAAAPDDSPLAPDEEKALQQMTTELYPSPDELLPYVKVTKADLPDCTRYIPRLADKSWWLVKQTWTFTPEEMRDLEFEPTLPAFAEMLGSKYGFFADASLTSLGSDGVPTIIAAMQSTNPIVRVNAAGIFYGKFGSYWNYAPGGIAGKMNDPGFMQAATTWLNDSEPKVRMAGIATLTWPGSWDPKFAEPLIALLRDKDAEVRLFVVAMLGSVRFRNDMETFIPIFEQMLKDKNPEVQGAGLVMLQRQQVEIPREDLLPFFKSSDWRVLDAAYDLLRDRQKKMSDDDALILLQNPQPVAQLLALAILGQNPEKQSVELALPLLKAPDEFVRLRAAQTLRTLTGQHFTEDQTEEWVKWWTENKTNLVFQLHPKELRTRRP
jgi:HEAT repeat protein